MTTPDDRMLDNDEVDTDPELGGRPQQTPATQDDGRPQQTPATHDGRPPQTPAAPGDGRPHQATAVGERLVDDELAVDYRTRWEVVQQGFVDDPRNAVSEADKLVDEVLEQLADGFDRQHQALEQQWSDGEPSTEELRSALQRYRAFFQRLLTI